MEFRTKVELPIGLWQIRHSDKLMLWGSCFVEHVGKLLENNKFTCLMNPYGILYNPMSIGKAMTEILDGKSYGRDDLHYNGRIWYSLMHHGSFSALDPDDCLERINGSLEKARKQMDETDWLILTFGTSRVYEWKEDGQIVGNCHKLPDSMFRRRLLEVDEIVDFYTVLLQRLFNKNPRLNVLFTVSPIRHAKDGMHGNQLNKAVLLLAVDKLCNKFANCFYFPSYEIMMDELRDYRFYADDMLHPSEMAVKYIWKCFCSVSFDKKSLDFMKEWDSIRKGLEHIPFNPQSENYHTFIRQILLKIECLKEKFPYLDAQNEIAICQVRLKK